MPKPDRDEPPPQLEEVYTLLRAIAQQRLPSERRDHALQATALVHEAWLRIRTAVWVGRGETISDLSAGPPQAERTMSGSLDARAKQTIET